MYLVYTRLIDGISHLAECPARILAKVKDPCNLMVAQARLRLECKDDPQSYNNITFDKQCLMKPSNIRNT